MILSAQMCTALWKSSLLVSYFGALTWLLLTLSRPKPLTLTKGSSAEDSLVEAWKEGCGEWVRQPANYWLC